MNNGKILFSKQIYNNTKSWAAMVDILFFDGIYIRECHEITEGYMVFCVSNLFEENKPGEEIPEYEISALKNGKKIGSLIVSKVKK